MIRVMLFIDGTWLYANTPRLADAFGDPDFHVDFGKLPRVLADEVSRQMGDAEIDVVRVHLFGSYAANYDLRDDEAVQRWLDFFDRLKEEYHYEVELFPVNFMGRRLRKIDRAPDDPFEPKEKCVDISLATAMMYYAAIPGAYDIGLAVVGDRDFTPMLQNVRRLGKRVAIASIKGSCSPEFADPRDEARVKDYDIIWLDDLLHRLELKYERHQLACEAPIHKGARLVWTTFHPRKGQKFFCEECRREFSRQKAEMQTQFVSNQMDTEAYMERVDTVTQVSRLTGVIKRKFWDRNYGFIAGHDGLDYFFHLDDVMDGYGFDEIYEGLQVEFEVRKRPSPDKAGAAQRVRVQNGRMQEDAEDEDELEEHYTSSEDEDFVSSEDEEFVPSEDEEFAPSEIEA